jgi:hypothetical protein
MATVKQRLEANSFFDAAIVRHGFVDYMRDYELLVSGREPPHTDWHRYQFVGCVEARTVTALKPEYFVASLPDDFVYSGPDYPEKDDPPGFIWGVRFSSAYPGLTYVDESAKVREWSARLGVPMHEVLIDTEAFQLSLVFHDFRYQALGSEPEFQPPSKDYPISAGA